MPRLQHAEQPAWYSPYNAACSSHSKWLLWQLGARLQAERLTLALQCRAESATDAAAFIDALAGDLKRTTPSALPSDLAVHYLERALKASDRATPALAATCTHAPSPFAHAASGSMGTRVCR